MSTSGMLSPEDERRVADAITAAEATTSGEIVAVVARSSGAYGYFALLWAALAALLVPWPLIYLTWWPMQWVFALQIAIFLALLALLQIPALHRHVVPHAIQRHWAHQNAVEQFLAQGIHTTEDRTGVLIFVSVAERYAEIIADTGIDKKVAPDTWKRMVDDLVGHMSKDRPADAFVSAITTAGDLLARNFPPEAVARTSVLPNRLIVLP